MRHLKRYSDSECHNEVWVCSCIFMPLRRLHTDWDYLCMCIYRHSQESKRIGHGELSTNIVLYIIIYHITHDIIFIIVCVYHISYETNMIYESTADNLILHTIFRAKPPAESSVFVTMNFQHATSKRKWRADTTIWAFARSQLKKMVRWTCYLWLVENEEYIILVPILWPHILADKIVTTSSI